jgi:hypothetical protein
VAGDADEVAQGVVQQLLTGLARRRDRSGDQV